MASRAPKPASDSASASPERVVLWFEDGKSNKVYVAERNGARWTARYGKRTQETRAEKIYELATAEAAEKAFLKAVATKEKEGYRRAPAGDAAKKVIKQAFGLDVEERDGKVVITTVAPRPDTPWIKPGGAIHCFACGKYLYVTVLEEVAIVAETMKGEKLYMEVRSGLGGVTSAITVR